MKRALIRVGLGALLVCVTAGLTSAQQQTATTQTKKFQIIAVDGNQLVVKLPEGTRELTVPDDFQFEVDGKMLSVRELKPGMAGTASITTRTTVTPVTVTEVKNGTVFQASGGSIIVKTDEGFKSFTQGDIDKRAIKIMKDGQPAQISDFHANDRLTATIITSKPPHVLTQKEVKATLAQSEAPAGAAPAAAPRASAPPSGAAAAAPPAKPTGTTSTPAPNPTPAAGAGAAPKKLPKTASALPELGLISITSLVAALGLAVTRRRSPR